MNQRRLALIIPLALVLFAVLAPSLAPYSVEEQFRIIVDESGAQSFAPHLPSRAHPLGTDRWGYDILTLMLHGMPYTVLFPLGASLLRVAVSLSLVLVSSRFQGIEGVARSRRESGLLATIPQFLVAYFALVLVTVNPLWSTGGLVFFQWLVIALVGLPATLPSVRGIVAAGLRKEYVEAARVVGVGRRRIIFRHLLPNIRGEFSTLFLFDTITVLLVMGQLGIFNVFIGGTRYTPFPPLFHSIVHEWAGLLGQYRSELFSMEWWVAFWPLLGYAAFIALLSGVLRLLEKEPGMAATTAKPVMSRV